MNVRAVHAGNPQDQQDRDARRNMKYERDTAVAEMVLGVCASTVTVDACMPVLSASTYGSCPEVPTLQPGTELAGQLPSGSFVAGLLCHFMHCMSHLPSYVLPIYLYNFLDIFLGMAWPGLALLACMQANAFGLCCRH